MFDREYDLRLLRLEFIGKVFIAEPQTIKRPALGGTGRINLAAGPLVAELAPLVHRFFQRGDRHHLAAQSAASAGSHGTLPLRVESGDEIARRVQSAKRDSSTLVEARRHREGGSGCDAHQRLAATAAQGASRRRKSRDGAKDGSNVAPDSPCPAGAPVLATPPLRDGAKDGVKRGAYYDSGER